MCFSRAPSVYLELQRLRGGCSPTASNFTPKKKRDPFFSGADPEESLNHFAGAIWLAKPRPPPTKRRFVHRKHPSSPPSSPGQSAAPPGRGPAPLARLAGSVLRAWIEFFDQDMAAGMFGEGPVGQRSDWRSGGAELGARLMIDAPYILHTTYDCLSMSLKACITAIHCIQWRGELKQNHYLYKVRL